VIKIVCRTCIYSNHLASANDQIFCLKKKSFYEKYNHTCEYAVESTNLTEHMSSCRCCAHLIRNQNFTAKKDNHSIFQPLNKCNIHFQIIKFIDATTCDSFCLSLNPIVRYNLKKGEPS